MIRPMILGKKGWYPTHEKECREEIRGFIDDTKVPENARGVSCIVPHAGWYYSGRIAVNTLRIAAAVRLSVRRIFIFGGHMPEKELPILETFEKAQTPLGDLVADTEAQDFIRTRHQVRTTEYLADNTIEIQLPLIRYFFPDSLITAVYLPPEKKTISFCESLYDRFHEDSLFIGSTDLTHYGPNYGIYHNDPSVKPVDWVKDVNDREFINHLLHLELEESISHALKNHSACSSGASLGAAAVAKRHGVRSGNLLNYYTSYDIRKDDSFVGYAGILY